MNFHKDRNRQKIDKKRTWRNYGKDNYHRFKKELD